jgi:hypothetical protein
MAMFYECDRCDTLIAADTQRHRFTVDHINGIPANQWDFCTECFKRFLDFKEEVHQKRRSA